MKMKKYELMATCQAGAKTFHQGFSIKECIEKFDNIYKRSGFKIIVRDLTTCKTVKVLKTSYR